MPLAAWLIALRLSDENARRQPLMLGATAGAVFALFAWIDAFDLHASVARAALATPLYIVAGALLVSWFRRVEGILPGVMIVALGTALLIFGVPSVVEAVLPVPVPAAD